MDNEQLVFEMIHSATRMRKVTHKYSFGNLSHKEFFMLGRIIKASDKYGDSNGIYVSNIAKEMEMSVPSVSRMLRGLEQKGYIIRQVDEANRRNTYVRITEVGRIERDRVHEMMHSYLIRVISKMGEDNTRQMIDYVNQMAIILEEVWNSQNEK